jgi:hypothetical protein
MKLQDQQTQLQLRQQIQAISADTNLSKEDKDEQLRILGVDPATIKTNEGIGFLGWGAATREDANFGDVARAVGITALAAGAIFVFGPILAGMIKGGIAGSAGLLKGKVGLAGWKKVFGTTMKQSGAVGKFSGFTPGQTPAPLDFTQFIPRPRPRAIAQAATPTAVNQTIDWFNRTPTPGTMGTGRVTSTGPGAMYEISRAF